MQSQKLLFDEITGKLVSEYSAVEPGRMMSSPAITFAGKVFAFFYQDEMIFKLGRDFDAEADVIAKYSILSPFKTKPPLLDWYQIPFSESASWERLARYALARMSARPGK